MASSNQEVGVCYKFRDIRQGMVDAWKKEFASYGDRIEISLGDIFKGAPSADTVVSPANSFGFMDGGIDMVLACHFGWQIQKRLQKIIREEHHGELLVGDAIIIPTFEGGATEDSMEWKGFNEDKPIKYLISAPTMRVPLDVRSTVNSYLAFRAIILAVKKHNSTEGNEPIRSVLCCGLGTAVGSMPFKRCAYQMRRAYEINELGKFSLLREPGHLEEVWEEHESMAEYGTNTTSNIPPPPRKKQEEKK